jgi:hypothetical protein
MFLSKKIHLREDEKILEVIRRYWLTDLWKYKISFVFLFGSSFFMFYLFSYGWQGCIIFVVSFLIGIYIILRTWFFSNYNMFVITSERIADVHRAGWFDEIISSVSHKDIKDVAVRKKGVLANIFNYGSLIVQSSSQQFVLEVVKIHFPQEVQARLGEIREQYLSNRKLANTQAVYHNFLKIISDLSDEELKNVSEEINKQFEEDSE